MDFILTFVPKAGYSVFMAPKSPRKPQWDTRLDAYHRFVVLKLKNALGVSKSEVIARMVEQWVVAHAETVAQAEATLAEWNQQKDTWKDADHE